MQQCQMDVIRQHSVHLLRKSDHCLAHMPMINHQKHLMRLQQYMLYPIHTRSPQAVVGHFSPVLLTGLRMSQPIADWQA